MKNQLIKELAELNVAEKRLLGEALISSAENEAFSPPISEAQTLELRSRLAYHRSNPAEQGISFQQLKANLLGAHRRIGAPRRFSF